MDHAPAVAKIVAVDAADVKASVAVVLQDGHAVDLPFQQQVHRMAAELRGVKAIEIDRPAAALGVPDFAGEDRGSGRFVAPFAGEVAVSQPIDQNLPQRFGRAAEDLVAGRIGRSAVTSPSSRPFSSTIPSAQTITTFFCSS